MTTVILLNPMGTDVTNFVNGTFGIPQLLKGTVMSPGDTLYTLPYDNTSGVANITAGVALLDAKLDSTTGPKRVVGYSEGCQIADEWLSNQGASTPVDPDDLSFLLLANADRKYGGFVYGHDVFNDVAYTGGKPDDTDYSVIDFARQFDGVSDFPTATAIVDALDSVESVVDNATALADGLRQVAAAMGDTPSLWQAAENAVAGLVLIHNNYLNVTVGDPTNLTLTEGNIRWVWSPTYPVPLLGVGATLPQSDQQLRTQIETAYSRPVTIPMPNYADDAAWGVEPFPVAVPAGPVPGWWAQS